MENFTQIPCTQLEPWISQKYNHIPICAQNGLTRWRHNKTGVNVIFCNTPTTYTSFRVIALSHPVSNAGEGHIVEHLLLDGSESIQDVDFIFCNYPFTFSSRLDATVGDSFATYCFVSLGNEGYKPMLSSYIDSILSPYMLSTNPELDFQGKKARILSETSFVRRDGFNAGVIYSELLMREDNDLIMAKSMICNYHYYGSPLMSFHGGKSYELENITPQKLIDFHQSQYHTANISVFVAGSTISQSEILNALEDPLKKIAEKPDFNQGNRLWSTPLIPRVLEPRKFENINISKTLSRAGKVWFSWRIKGYKEGPKKCLAAETLFSFLIREYWSPLNAYLRDKQDFATNLSLHMDFRHDYGMAIIFVQGIQCDELGTELVRGALEKQVNDFFTYLIETQKIPFFETDFLPYLRNTAARHVYRLERHFSSSIIRRSMEESPDVNHAETPHGFTTLAPIKWYLEMENMDEKEWIDVLKSFYFNQPQYSLRLIPNRLFGDENVNTYLRSSLQRRLFTNQEQLARLNHDIEMARNADVEKELPISEIIPVRRPTKIKDFTEIQHNVMAYEDLYLFITEKNTAFITCTITFNVENFSIEEQCLLHFLCYLLPQSNVKDEERGMVPYMVNIKDMCFANVSNNLLMSYRADDQTVRIEFSSTRELFANMTELVMRMISSSIIQYERMRLTAKELLQEIYEELDKPLAVFSSCNMGTILRVIHQTTDQRTFQYIGNEVHNLLPVIEAIHDCFKLRGQEYYFQTSALANLLDNVLCKFRNLTGKYVSIDIESQEPRGDFRNFYNIWSKHWKGARSIPNPEKENNRKHRRPIELGLGNIRAVRYLHDILGHTAYGRVIVMNGVRACHMRLTFSVRIEKLPIRVFQAMPLVMNALNHESGPLMKGQRRGGLSYTCGVLPHFTQNGFCIEVRGATNPCDSYLQLLEDIEYFAQICSREGTGAMNYFRLAKAICATDMLMREADTPAHPSMKEDFDFNFLIDQWEVISLEDFSNAAQEFARAIQNFDNDPMLLEIICGNGSQEMIVQQFREKTEFPEEFRVLGVKELQFPLVEAVGDYLRRANEGIEFVQPGHHMRNDYWQNDHQSYYYQ